MNKERGPRPKRPAESDFRWDYFDGSRDIPVLTPGQVVLVRYFFRSRLATVHGRIPGGLYWGALMHKVEGSSRVVISRSSLVAVARNEE